MEMTSNNFNCKAKINKQKQINLRYNKEQSIATNMRNDRSSVQSIYLWHELIDFMYFGY